MDKLDEILNRGFLKVAVRNAEHSFIKWPSGVGIGEPEGFEPTLARCLAVALFNDPRAVEWYTSDSSTRFSYVRDGIVDVTFRGATATITRDAPELTGAQGDVDFAPVYFYDFNFIFLRSSYVGNNPLMDPTVKIGVKSTAFSALTLWKTTNGYAFSIFEVTEDTDLALQGYYNNGTVDGISADGSILKGLDLTTPYRILPEYTTEEPLAPVVPKNENRWQDVVRWVYYALLQAEEYGRIDKNTFGKEQATWLGLDQFWARNVINKFGNYGQIYERTLPLTFFEIDYVPPKNTNRPKPPTKLRITKSRGLNDLYTNGGIQYPMPGL